MSTNNDVKIASKQSLEVLPSGDTVEKAPQRADTGIYDTLRRYTDDYVFVYDLNRNITRIPAEMAEEFELPGETIYDFQHHWVEKIHPDDQRNFIEIHGKIAEKSLNNVSHEFRARNKNGDWSWIMCRGSIVDPSAENRVYAGIYSNLSYKNKVDPVTGLLNKFEFESAVSKLISNGEKFYIAVLNADNFSRINELYDRNFGDDVLRVNAQYLQNVLSNSGGVFRLDNDSFGVIFTDSTRDVIADGFDAIRAHYSSPQSYKSYNYYFSFSIGCVPYDEFSDTYILLLKNAHTALEYAKTHGKNKLMFYAPQLTNTRLRTLEISEMIRESVENNFRDFEVFTQPQVDVKCGGLKGGEALLRWHCEKYGPVSPVEFIPILEETNLISPVGRWVFEVAVNQLKTWLTFQPDFNMSVNVSYIQIFDAGFVDFIKETIEKVGVPFENVTLELTESRFINDKDLLRSIFMELRSLGINIAMDDFGTGYSSLEILKDIPADIVKIDRTFVRNIKKSAFDITFIKFIVELCHNAGLKVCLEGIEELEEINAVSNINLDYIQGFLFGKPQDSTSFQKMHFSGPDTENDYAEDE